MEGLATILRGCAPLEIMIRSSSSVRLTARSSSEIRLPSGLFGDVRNTSFGWCSSTARLIPAQWGQHGAWRSSAFCFNVCSRVPRPQTSPPSLTLALHIDAEALQTRHLHHRGPVDLCIVGIHAERGGAVDDAIARLQGAPHQEIEQLVGAGAGLLGTEEGIVGVRARFCDSMLAHSTNDASCMRGALPSPHQHSSRH